MSLSFDKLVENPDEDVDTVLVETKRGMVTVAAATSEGMLNWLAENEAGQRFRGLRLVARCILSQGEQRIPEDQVPAAVEALKKRSADANASLIDAAFKVNGVVLRAPKGDSPKNESGEASTGTGASPTDSPSQPAE